jgi:hypothetical protein
MRKLKLILSEIEQKITNLNNSKKSLLSLLFGFLFATLVTFMALKILTSADAQCILSKHLTLTLTLIFMFHFIFDSQLMFFGIETDNEVSVK